MLNKRGGAWMATLSVILLASCSTASNLSATLPVPGRSASSARPALAPVSGRALQSLPGGVFYFLAGTTPGLCNVWEVRNSGAVRELTRNSEFGISAFGAAHGGIVVADAAHGADELGQVTLHGIRYLPTSSWEGHGETPAVNNSAGLAYMTPPFRKKYFELLSRGSFNAKARVFYTNSLPLSMPAWGPGGQVAVVAERYRTTTAKAKSRLMVISAKDGKARTLHTGLSQFDYAIWGTNAPGIVISPWAGGAEYISHGKQLNLPSGWAPLSWSPDGKELLMKHPASPGKSEQLGLWTNRHPGTVRFIGHVSTRMIITEAIWLAEPAALN